ncbi:MAG: T9SS type A sorting domain-containing protein [candidate division WOR-3 bacterium]
MLLLLSLFIINFGVNVNFDLTHQVIMPNGIQIMESSQNEIPIYTYPRFDSLNMHFVGNWPYGYAYAVAYDSIRNLCFLSSGGGVYILDISDPTGPVELSRIKTRGGPILGLYFLANFLYLSDWSYGFEIWNVSNPNFPTKIGGCPIQGGLLLGDGAWGLAVSPPYAYVVSKDAGLVVVDISNPTFPFEVSRCDLPGQSTAVVLSGEHAYVAYSGHNELAIIDITDPLNPILVGNCPIMFTPVDVTIAGSYAYVCGLSWFHTFTLAIIDVSTPSNPVLLSQSLFGGDCRGICINDTLLYLAGGKDGIFIINVSNPYNPIPINNFNTPHSAHDVAIIDTFVLVADCDRGLRIINTSTPSNPHEIGFYDTPGYAYNSVVSYPYLYLFDGLSGVYILDITELQNPVEIGHFEDPDNVFSVGGILQYPYLFIADGPGGLRILDISEPSNPVQVGNCSTYYAYALGIKDTFAFVVNGSEGLTVINIAEPSNPYVVISDTAIKANNIIIKRNYAYTIGSAGYYSYFNILDISNPLNPILIGSYNAGEGPALAIKDTFAFIGTASDSLLILNISNPANPTPVSSYFASGTINGIAIKGDFAVITTVGRIPYENLVEIIDISDIHNPFNAGFYTPPFSPLGITIMDTLIFVSNSTNGLNIYASSLLLGIEGKISGIPIEVLEICPNPFSKLTKISFGKRHCKNGVKLKIYDATGRLVRQWDDKTIGQTDHIIWDGFDEQKRKVSTGVYFVSLENKDRKINQKVILIK